MVQFQTVEESSDKRAWWDIFKVYLHQNRVERIQSTAISNCSVKVLLYREYVSRRVSVVYWLLAEREATKTAVKLDRFNYTSDGKTIFHQFIDKSVQLKDLQSII